MAALALILCTALLRLSSCTATECEESNEHCAANAPRDTSSMLQSATSINLHTLEADATRGGKGGSDVNGGNDYGGDDGGNGGYDDYGGYGDDYGGYDDDGGEYTCEELRSWFGEEYDEGPCAKPIDTSWTTNVPKNMTPIKNVGKNCQKPCMMEKLSDPNATWSGTCDGFCGQGNACCKFNDPLAPKECTGVAPEAFIDEYGDLQQMRIRCTWPKEAPPNKSNYQKYKDEAWKEAMEILNGKVPTKMSTLAAPNIDLPAYSKTEGKADVSAYLAMGQDLNGWKAKCPAFDNPAYKLANNGMFPDMTYYKYPYYVMYPDLKVDLFCGARYTDDPSPETAENAAKMAQKACDDMGDKCGGFAVGTDPECCSSKEPGEPGAGCTEVVFLNPSAKTASIEKQPCSFKTCTWACNYVTYIKN